MIDIDLDGRIARCRTATAPIPIPRAGNAGVLISCAAAATLVNFFWNVGQSV